VRGYHGRDPSQAVNLTQAMDKAVREGDVEDLMKRKDEIAARIKEMYLMNEVNERVTVELMAQCAHFDEVYGYYKKDTTARNATIQDTR
jgi:hypothetical protein